MCISVWECSLECSSLCLCFPMLKKKSPLILFGFWLFFKSSYKMSHSHNKFLSISAKSWMSVNLKCFFVCLFIFNPLKDAVSVWFLVFVYISLNPYIQALSISPFTLWTYCTDICHTVSINHADWCSCGVILSLWLWGWQEYPQDF